METKAGGSPVAILVVEDEAITLAFLAGTIAKKYPDCRVYQALNGAAGLELFREHQPEIVITDLNMPEMTGVEMGREIQALKPETKLIALTGERRGQLSEDLCGNGLRFDHCIDKPIHFWDLFAAIEKCLGDAEPADA